MDIWQEKVRRFRKITTGWSRNVEAELRKNNKKLMEEYDRLDVKMESSSLSEQEELRTGEIYAELQAHWLKEEIKSRQRSRDRDVKERDRNTSYFQSVASQRRRKTYIHSLEGPDGIVTDTPNILKVARDYYKNMFSGDSNRVFLLHRDFFSEEEKVTESENDTLQKPFTEEEVKEAVFSSYADGAPGPDGIPFLFTKIFGI